MTKFGEQKTSTVESFRISRIFFSLKWFWFEFWFAFAFTFVYMLLFRIRDEMVFFSEDGHINSSFFVFIYRFLHFKWFGVSCRRLNSFADVAIFVCFLRLKSYFPSTNRHFRAFSFLFFSCQFVSIVGHNNQSTKSKSWWCEIRWEAFFACVFCINNENVWTRKNHQYLVKSPCSRYDAKQHFLRFTLMIFCCNTLQLGKTALASLVHEAAKNILLSWIFSSMNFYLYFIQEMSVA